MRIDRHLTPAARSSVLAVEVEGEQVLYDERTGRLHALNGTAAVIWSCCDGTATLGELVDELADAFQVSKRDVRTGVYATVETLLEEGLLTVGDPLGDTVDHLPSPADLGTPCTPCLAALDALAWAGWVRVAIGELRTGVRATTAEGFSLVQQLLAPITTTESSDATHYSVVLADPQATRGARELNQLYFGHVQVMRSRSRGRVLRALVAQLDGHLDSTRREHLLVGGRILVRDDAMLLLARDFAADLDALEPRLRRLGIAVSDAPSVELLGGGKGAISAPALAVDEHVLSELDQEEAGGPELEQPQPGPRRLAGWVLPSRREAGTDVPAPDALRAIIATVRNLSGYGTAQALDLLAGEVARAPVRSLPVGSDLLVDEITSLLGR